jgi:hypothetical protein
MTVISQRPGRLDLDIVRGDEAAVELTWQDTDGNPIDVSGATYSAVLLDVLGSPIDGGTLTVDGTDEASGVQTIPISADISALLTDGVYRWKLRDTTNDRELLDGLVRPSPPGLGGVRSGATSATVITTNSTAAVTVTAAVVGPSGADGSGGLDEAAVDARIAAATLDGAQIQSGTVPDAHIPSSIARDSEVSAAVASVTLAGLTDVALDGTPSDGQVATWQDGKLTNSDLPNGFVAGSGEGAASSPIDATLSAIASGAPLSDFDGASVVALPATLVVPAPGTLARRSWECPVVGRCDGAEVTLGVGTGGTSSVLGFAFADADGPVPVTLDPALGPGWDEPIDGIHLFFGDTPVSVASSARFAAPRVLDGGDVQLVVFATDLGGGVPDLSLALRWRDLTDAEKWLTDRATAAVAELTDAVAGLTDADITLAPKGGLFANYMDSKVADLLAGIEGRFDNLRFVTSIVMPDIDLDTLTAGPVADEDQPIDHRGQRVAKGTHVGILSTGPDSLGGRWHAHVHPDTGQWTILSQPDAATTNGLVGGSVLKAVDGTIASYIGFDGDGNPDFKQAQFGTGNDEADTGVWSVISPTAGGLDEAAVQALIDAAVSNLLDGAPGA